MIEPTDSQRAQIDFGDAAPQATDPVLGETVGGRGCVDLAAGFAIFVVMGACFLVALLALLGLIASFLR